MFRKTKKEVQLDLFSSVSNLLKGQAYEQYNDLNKWHNQFREHIVKVIDEEIFRELFDDKMGAPNSPISILIAMMILKESSGWSDLTLFDRCRFDLLVRSALGLFNLTDPIPAESTYYLLRKRIYEYQKGRNIDLLEQVFQKVTCKQIEEFGVSGRSIRMDSKLISSNIAFYSRYEIIHQTLALFCREVDTELISGVLNTDSKLIEELLKEQGNKVVYRNNKEEIIERMQKLGLLAYKLLSIIDSQSNIHYQTLQRVFQEQYQVTEGEKIELRPKEEISADSVQSHMTRNVVTGIRIIIRLKAIVII